MTTSVEQEPHAAEVHEQPAREAAVGHSASAVALARAAMLNLAHHRLPPTPANYARAWQAVGGGDCDAPGAAGRELHQAERLTVELTEMIRTLCDTISALAEDDRWVSGHVGALREMLAGEIEYVTVSELRGLLGQTAHLQRSIADGRRESLAQLKSALMDLMAMMGGLLDTSERFNDRITEHAQEIGTASSVSGLSSSVQRLLDDARNMKGVVDESREGLKRSQANAEALAIEVARLEEQLATASADVTTDHLTKVANRRGLEDAFLRSSARARFSGQPLSVALIDVDDFKKLNDTLGHSAGDEALRQLAALLQAKLRPDDTVARFGGEEFVILLGGADVGAAQQTMLRMQRELTAHVFMGNQERRFITFSAGVTLVGPDDTLTSAVARADEAMYRAKRAGKNCVKAG